MFQNALEPTALCQLCNQSTHLAKLVLSSPLPRARLCSTNRLSSGIAGCILPRGAVLAQTDKSGRKKRKTSLTKSVVLYCTVAVHVQQGNNSGPAMMRSSASSRQAVARHCWKKTRRAQSQSLRAVLWYSSVQQQQGGRPYRRRSKAVMKHVCKL